MLLILVSLCGLISCVSQHKHLLVHLSCHSITKTKEGPFTWPFAPAETVVKKVVVGTAVRETAETDDRSAREPLCLQ